MRSILNLGLKLFIISAVAGLALGATNAITAEPIRQQEILAANAARMAVLPAAATFEETATEGAMLGKDASGNVVGATASVVVQGFGGKIEVTVGMDDAGEITGVSIGGSEFSETAGLGARTKEAWFGEQYVGGEAPFALKKNGGSIDAVTSATISSTAVTDGVNQAAELLKTVLTEVGK